MLSVCVFRRQHYHSMVVLTVREVEMAKRPADPALLPGYYHTLSGYYHNLSDPDSRRRYIL